MKLLLVHRYLRPDTPGYAHMLYLMGKHFAAAGHEVTIFSAQPGYNDAYAGPKLPRKQFVDGMTVIRTPLLRENKRNAALRSLNFLLFSISLLWHAVFRWKPYEVMFVSTFPPMLMGSLARKIKFIRDTRYVYHCMDLYPEIALATGMAKNGWLKKLAAGIDRRNCQSADRVIVLSDDMADSVRDRGLIGENLVVLNNFIIDQVDPEFTLPSTLQTQPNRFRVLFAGNLGRFQSLDTVMEAAQQLSLNEEIEFLFVGSGVMADRLKQQAGSMLGTTVHFHPYMPINEVMSLIAESHLGIVSLAPGIIEAAYPSKTMSYLEAGCKILALVESESELAQLIEFEQLGVVCPNRTGEDLAAAIEEQFDAWKRGQYDRERIQAVGRKHFSQQVILARWIGLLEEIESEAAAQL